MPESDRTFFVTASAPHETNDSIMADNISHAKCPRLEQITINLIGSTPFQEDHHPLIHENRADLGGIHIVYRQRPPLIMSVGERFSCLTHE